VLAQWFWAAVAFGVPVGALLSRRYRVLVAWICLSTCVDIFNVTAAININAPTVAGLVLVPRTVRQMLGGRSGRSERLILWQFAYLCVLGLVFGLLWPWPNPPDRPWNLRVQGRALLYLMRTLAAICAAVFIAEQVTVEGGVRRVQRYIVRGTALAAVAGVLAFLLGPRFGLFNFVSQGLIGPNPANFGTRAAGLNFEPRGLGLAAAHGAVLAALFWSRRRSAKWSALAAACLAAVLVSRSTSGLVALCVGAVAAGASDRRARRWVWGSLAAVLVAGGISMVVWGKGQVATGVVGQDSWAVMLSERLGAPERYGTATSLFEQLVFRTEIFDAPAILFLAATPEHLLFGTGPGLVIFPASAFIPVSSATEELVEEGLRSPPTMGLVLEVANAGAIGLVLWLLSAVYSWFCLRHLSVKAGVDREAWRLSVPMFVAAAAMYLVAAGFSSSFWVLFMGMGFGASRLIRSERSGPSKGRAGGAPSEAVSCA
jgi:hypothetical protein